MKLYIQWTTRTAKDWQQYDSQSLAAIAHRGVPQGNESLDEQPGWIHAVNIQGMEFSGYDHYAFEDLPDGALKAIMWSDDDDDSTREGSEMLYSAQEVIFRPLAPDPNYGGAWTTNITRTQYCSEEEHNRRTNNGNLIWENTEWKAWEDFVPPERAFHGVWVSDEHNEDLIARRSRHGWREWTEGVSALEVDGGVVRDQRAAGNWEKPTGTRTYYQTNTDLAIGAIPAATYEKLMGTTADGTSTDLTAQLRKNTSDVYTHEFGTPANEPNNATWPSGTYRCVLDITAIGSLSNVYCNFYRFISALNNVVDGPNQQDEAAWTTTGLKTATVSWTPTGSTQSDRAVVAFVGANTDTKNNADLVIQVGLTENYMDGPWTAASNTYDETMQPGMELAGLSVTSLVHEETPTKGVHVAGESDESFSDLIEVGGGLQGNGLANTGRILSETVTGGAEGSGRASLIYNIIPEGGVELNGSIVSTQIHKEIAAGGVEANGEAFVQKKETYNETMAGGAEANGEASPTGVFYESGEGGIELAGAADESQSYNEFGSGGIELNGTAGNTQRYSESGSGGIELAGSARQTQNHKETASGGAEAAGTADESFSDLVEVSGGVELSGQAKPTQAYSEVASGGAELAGAATEQYVPAQKVYNETMQGGIELAGVAQDNHRHEESGSGGAELAGVATKSLIETESSSGGIELAGVAAKSLIETESSSGGIELAGVATQTQSQLETTSGGIELAGVATQTIAMEELVSGGAEASGLATDDFFDVIETDGGLEAAGTASFAATFNAVVSGGAEANGEVVAGITSNVPVGGGAEIAGAASHTQKSLWVNPGNITSDDGQKATVSLNNSSSTILQSTLHGLGLNPNAKITGIGITIEFSSNVAVGFAHDVRLHQNGTPIGIGQGSIGEPVLADINGTKLSFGGKGSTWNTNLTGADVNADTFGVQLFVQSSGTVEVSVDYISLCVWYEVAGTLAGGTNEPFQSFAEVAAGGVEVAGEAEETFNEVVEVGGGVEAAGSAQVYVEILTSGGVEVSGTVSAFYEEIMSGGVEVAGEATEGRALIETGQGGAEVAGSADESFSDVIETSGGAETAGQAGIYVIYNIQASGGAEVAGDAITTSGNDVVASGGAEAAGQAGVYVIYNIQASGGAEVAGAADEAFGDIVEVGGGAEAAGQAGVYVLYNPQASGGAEVAGAANETFSEVIEVGGGAEAAGQAGVYVIYNIQASGGAEVAGSADESFSDIIEIGGGVETAGQAGVYVLYNPQASGGAEVAGDANYTSGNYIVASGGVEVAGTHVQTFIDYFVASGGAEVAGAAEVTVEGSYDEIMSGGVEVAGTARTTAIYNITAQGGAEVAGNAYYTSGNDIVAEGGAEVAGAATVQAIYNPAALGGAEVAGESDETFSDVIEASGGVEISGTAVLTQSYAEVATGGAEVSGSVTESQSYDIQPSGGATTNGQSTHWATYNPINLGGAAVGGTVSEGISYSIDTAGGVIVSGLASQPYDEVGHGGVLVGGQISGVYDETMSGGVIVDGMALLTTIFSDADKSPNITWDTNTQFTIQDGQLLIVIFTTDNEDSTNGPSNIHESIVIDGQPMIKAGEYTEAQGATDAGVTVSIWYLLPIGTIESGSTVATSLTSGRSAKAISGFVVDIGRGLRITVDGYQEGGGTAADPEALSATGVETGDHLWIRGIGLEDANETIGWMYPTANWNKFEDNGSTGNPPTSNISVRGEWKFSTGTYSGISDPWVESPADNASLLVGLYIDPLKTWNQFIDGGVIVGGAGAEAYTGNESGNGGAKVNGTADVYVIMSAFEASGGVELAGTAFLGRIYNEIASGGAEVSGQAERSLANSYSGSGGVEVSGESLPHSIFNITGISGALVGGQATPGIQPATSGGAEVAGSVAELLSRNPVVSGGVEISGESDVDFTDFVDGTGGVKVGGRSHQESPIWKYTASGVIYVEGSAGLTGLAFFRVYPDGFIIVTGGEVDSEAGPVFKASGGVTVEGESSAGQPEYHYNTIGGLIIGGPAEYRFDPNARGGVHLNGEALVNVLDFSYDTTGGVIVETEDPTNTLTGASYRYNTTGGVTTGGTGPFVWNPFATGGTIVGGEAEINVQDLDYDATGGVIVETEDPTDTLTGASYRYNPTGKVVIGGETHPLKSVHSYTAEGGLEVGGQPNYTLVFYDRDCENVFACVVKYPNPYLECPTVEYYLNDCEVLNGKSCNVRSGAFLAAITACRQKFLLPDKDRHPEIPKVWH